MNLENKEKIDFVDSHLWGAIAHFFISVPIRRIPVFFGLLSDLKMTVHPHNDDTDDQDYFVNLEFVPDVMVAGRTARKLDELLRIGCETSGTVQICIENVVAKLDAQGNVLERWDNEPAVPR